MDFVEYSSLAEAVSSSAALSIFASVFADCFEVVVDGFVVSLEVGCVEVGSCLASY